MIRALAENPEMEETLDRRILFGVLLCVAVACGSATTAKEVAIKTPTLQCGSCEVTIKKAVKGVDGVQSVVVDGEDKVVRVTYAQGTTDVAQIETAIAMAGYQANNKKADVTAYKSLPECCKIESAAH